MTSLFHLARPFAVAALCALMLGSVLPAQAIIRLDSKSIDAALVYGMKNQKLGLSTLLGPNWVEGADGSLLNVYSPFMMVATKAAKANLPMNPTKSDLKKARTRFGKEVAFYSDPKNRQQVKFSVSFYGNSIGFAKAYQARIEGFGRGKEFNIKPSKVILDQKADPAGSLYEGINAYYFNMSDLEDLQDFRLILESPQGNPVVFRLKNEKLY